MHLEPVLLIASLRTVLDRLVLALGAGVERNELLVELSTLAVVIRRVLDAILLILPDLLQRAFVVLALADVDDFVIGWVGDLWLDMVGGGVHHHGRVVEAALGEEADAVVSHRTRRTMELILASSRLHFTINY